ncbi:MAG: ATP synthase F1 subunit epsilon [Candidatus Lightella neohaematopini]|nr:ATP synthase F1 subunit epsilon [Candidatus Lightella neohaematopini]MCV2529057.1 ATP synthase F1 subunit epsilon [Candidatus Lightella neohaematopini]
MFANFKLTIVSIENLIFSDMVYKVLINSIEGELTILAKHAPLITITKPGVICINSSKFNNRCIFLPESILEIQSNNVLVISDSINDINNLIEEEIIKDKVRIESLLKKNTSINQQIKLSLELSKTLAKLQAIKLNKLFKINKKTY